MKSRTYGLIGFLLGSALFLLTACGEPRMMPAVTRIVATPEAEAPQESQVLPQVMAGGTGTSPVTPERTPPALRPEMRPTVWRPREIAAQVQQALADSLDVPVEAVPWERLVEEVDPAQLVCLDQLLGDLPTFGEGEALVFQYQGTPIYVVSSRGALWVCRQAAIEARTAPLSLEEAQAAAVADLAQRLGVDAATVEVVRAETVTWPDASAGCPQPGQAYAQVLTPGYEIVLKVNGTQYIYRGTTEQVFLCTTEE